MVGLVDPETALVQGANLQWSRPCTEQSAWVCPDIKEAYIMRQGVALFIPPPSMSCGSSTCPCTGRRRRMPNISFIIHIFLMIQHALNAWRKSQTSRGKLAKSPKFPTPAQNSPAIWAVVSYSLHMDLRCPRCRSAAHIAASWTGHHLSALHAKKRHQKGRRRGRLSSIRSTW